MNGLLIRRLFVRFLVGALAVVALQGCALPREKPFEATPASLLGTAPEGVGLAAGQRAPDAALTDASGGAATLLGDASGTRLLVFYKGGWCPTCHFQLRELATQHDALARRGVQVRAVSADLPAFSAEAQQTAPFPVLSDPTLAAHRAYRVLEPLGGMTTFMLGRMGADVKARTGQEAPQVAVPALFLVDRDGVIRWAHADRDPSTRPTVAQLLEVIDRLGLAPR
jgi:peroxiredoxin